MDIDPEKMDGLLAMERDIFDALQEAYRVRDVEVADRLFKIWIKLPRRSQG